MKTKKPATKHSLSPGKPVWVSRANNLSIVLKTPYMYATQQSDYGEQNQTVRTKTTK